jgi:hypothetical protein
VSKSTIQSGEPVSIEIAYVSLREIAIGDIRCNLVDQYNQLIADLYVDPEELRYVLSPGSSVLSLDLGRINLAPGEYYVNLSLSGENGLNTLIHATYIAEIKVVSNAVTTAPVLLGIVK